LWLCARGGRLGRCHGAKHDDREKETHRQVFTPVDYDASISLIPRAKGLAESHVWHVGCGAAMGPTR
jgi:hypothetical protein